MKTRTTLLLALAALLAAPAVRADLPKTLDELKERHAKEATEPQAAVKLLLDACFVYMNPDTRDEGTKMLQYLIIYFKSDDEWFKKASARTFVERLTKPEHQHIFRSYAKGTSPENGYEMDPNDWELDFQRTHQIEGDTRGLQVYLHSSGADNPRVIYVKKSDQTGLYYIGEFSSLYVGIRPPKKPGQEEFH